jgi:hypothetical protein
MSLFQVRVGSGLRVGAVLATVALLVACGAPAPGSNAKAPVKHDGKAWESNDAAYAAQGYKPGDATTWDVQMRTRAQNQDDYSRAK